MLNPNTPLLPTRKFAKRWLKYFLLASTLIVWVLGVGVPEYHFVARFDRLDSFLNASLILTEMGPVGRLEKAPAKVFASFYALFSGIVFLNGMGGGGPAFSPATGFIFRILPKTRSERLTRYDI